MPDQSLPHRVDLAASVGCVLARTICTARVVREITHPTALQNPPVRAEPSGAGPVDGQGHRGAGAKGGVAGKAQGQVGGLAGHADIGIGFGAQPLDQFDLTRQVAC